MSSNGAPPLIYVGGSHGAFGLRLQLYPLESTLGASEELPRINAELVGTMGQVGRPGRSVCLPEAPTTPKLDIWAVLVSLVLSPWGMACPTLVCLGIWLVLIRFSLYLIVCFSAHEVCFHPYFTCIHIITNTRGNGQ